MAKRQVFIFFSVMNTWCLVINCINGNYGNITINIIEVVACLTVLRGEKR